MLILSIFVLYSVAVAEGYTVAPYQVNMNPNFIRTNIS